MAGNCPRWSHFSIVLMSLGVLKPYLSANLFLNIVDDHFLSAAVPAGQVTMFSQKWRSTEIMNCSHEGCQFN